MAVEVLGLPESFEIANTQAMVGDAAREVSLYGQSPEQDPLSQQLGIEHFMIACGTVVVGGLVVFFLSQRPWQRK